MAKAKKAEVVETSQTVEPVADKDSEYITNDAVTEVYKEDTVVNQAEYPPAQTIDVVEELKYAQMQIDICATYLAVNDVGPNGYYRAGIKEWQRYRYNLRRYSVNQAPLPSRPAIIKDYIN